MAGYLIKIRMQKRIERRLTYFLGITFAAVILLFYMVPDIHRVSLASDGDGVATYSVMDLLRSGDELYSVDTTQTAKEVEHQLRLTLPMDVDPGKVSFTEDAMSKSFELTIPGVDSSYFYDYPMVGSSDGIRELTFAHAGDMGILDITTTKIKKLSLTVEDNYVYLDFADPHDVYDAIVVVDIGHGGNDVGANQGDIYEKNINLAIGYRLLAYGAKSEYNIGFYFTRVDDDYIDLEDRVALANDLKADLFLSIHNNSTASGRMSGINGAEVMYRVSDETGRSREFAETCLNELLEALDCNSKGVVAGDNIYIIRSSEVPVALAEIGFLTNQKELNNLNDPGYQDKAAQALYKAIVKTLKNNGADLKKSIRLEEK